MQAGPGVVESSMRRRLFAGMKSLTGFGSRSRHGSPGHRSISLPESTTLSYCFFNHCLVHAKNIICVLSRHHAREFSKLNLQPKKRDIRGLKNFFVVTIKCE